MTNEQLAILCKTDESYLPELWENVRHLISQWALRYIPADGNNARYDLDDLIQSAYFALLGAVRAYPEDSPLKFNTYLRYHCRTAFRDVLGIRTSKRTPPVLSLDAPLSSEDDFTLADVIEDVGASEAFAEAEERIYVEQATGALEQALNTIPNRERETVRKRYYENKPVKTIAAELGCSDGAVRQAEHNGLRSLRRGQAYKLLKPFDYRGEGLKHTGLSWYMETGVSSVEAAVWRMMGLERVEV